MSFTIDNSGYKMDRLKLRFIQTAIENAASLQGLRAISFNYDTKGVTHIVTYNVVELNDFSVGSKVEIGFTDESCWAWLNTAVNHRFNKTNFTKL